MSKTKSLQLRPLIIALAVIAVSALSWFGPRNQGVAHADFTGGTTAPASATNLYIPTDYTGLSDGVGEVQVKAGVAISKLRSLDLTLLFDPTQMEIYNNGTLTISGDPLDGKEAPDILAQNNTFQVRYTLSAGVDIDANQTLFRLPVHIKKEVVGPTAISIFNTGTVTIKMDATPNTNPPVDVTYTSPRFSSGKIAVLAATCTPDCGEYGSCNPTTKTCECNLGYMGSACKQCAAGYTGYPKCMWDIFSNLKGVILTLSPDTISKLTVDERKKAYSSAYVIFEKVPPFTGKIKLGTAEYDISCTSHASNDLEKIRECATAFAGNMQDTDPAIGPGWKASVVDGMSGVVKLWPQDPIATLDGISTTSGDVLIVPGMEYTMILDPLASYQTRAIGVLDSTTYVDPAHPVQILSTSHIVKDLTFNDVKWVPQPVNRLKSSALNGGLLERGDEVGTGPLYVELTKSDLSKVQSNGLTVEVPGGPVINYVKIGGSASLERGAQANLSVRVSDVDTISDIKDIRTSIVRSTKTTYQEIMANAKQGDIFTITPFDMTELAAINTTAQPGATPATTATVAQNYKVYSIPVEIPQDPNLVDGDYQLLLEISDTAGHMSTQVLPIHIGKAATGDVNGDGKINMLDVILAYQIANGKITPTQSQIEAANLDGKGNITMLDVVLLFNKVNNK